MLSSMGFYEQLVQYKNIDNRIEFLRSVCKDKDTLHIGCADWPVFNPMNNLHISLYNFNRKVDGYDKNIEAITKMGQLPELKDAKLYTELPQKKYEVILIPETIEHVNNPCEFLNSIIPLCTSETIILMTAPNAFSEVWVNSNKYIETRTDGGVSARSDGGVSARSDGGVSARSDGGIFLEIVHPDHKCWYSLYTLPSLIKSVYEDKVQIEEIGTIDRKTMVYVRFKISV